MSTDNRTAKQLLTEYRKIDDLKKSLVRQGVLNGDATPAEVIEAIRKIIPIDLFGEK